MNAIALRPTLSFRRINPRPLMLMALLALAACVGNAAYTAASSAKATLTHEQVCKCASCPGEGKCCCSAGFCDTPGGVK